MFVEINNKVYSKLYIQSISTEDGDNEYYIIYQLSNGSTITESFDSSSDRDSKLSEVVGE